MGLRSKFEGWMIRKEFNQDTFQSFVCWMLFAGTVCSFFTPAYLVLFQNTSQHCQHGTFTILAHYRIHSWLYEMFEAFKSYETQYNDVCFELVISDSQFESDDTPTVWIPENLVWLDEAEADNDLYGKTLVSSTDTQCMNIANIPMGLVTWSSFASVLSNPMDYNDFLTLSRRGWSQFTGGEIDINSFSFSHAHPNVTSSGVLGMVLGYMTQLNITTAFDYSEYEDIITDLRGPVREIESDIHELGPNELTVVSTLLGHGPEYIHATYGFENDVAYNNYQYEEILSALWDDTLSFVYFSQSFWMTHPLCVLDKADYISSKLENIGNEFQAFLSNSTKLEKLLDYGIRPSNVSQSTILSSSVLSTTYGVNPSVTDSESSSYSLPLPDYDTVESMRSEWQDLKEPVWLRILLDVSFGMQTAISGKSITRWARAIDGLDYFAEVLEDNAVVELECFAEEIVECGGDITYPNGTLENARSDIIDFIENDMVLSQQTGVALFDALNYSVTELRNYKIENDASSNYYNYVLVIISEDDSGASETTIDELLEMVGINYDADELHIFPISFYGTSGSKTEYVLSEIATRTNGEYYETQSEMADTLKEIGYYF